MTEHVGLPGSVDETEALFAAGDYIASRELATSVYIALKLERALLLEGEAGVGKTEVAKVLAATLGRELLRLQCYEGLDLATAGYEWNYPAQLLGIRMAEARGDIATVGENIYSEDYLVARPLLKALQPQANGVPVLLIDEIDRADEPFEAFLLEILSDFQMTIPELGTLRAAERPIVIITSNRTREVHDALRRRCFYHWVDYPSADAERRIVAARAPQIGDALRGQLVDFVQAMRDIDLYKRPGVAETIDWAQTLSELNAITLTPDIVNDTLGTLLKYRDDIAKLDGARVAELLAELPARKDS